MVNPPELLSGEIDNRLIVKLIQRRVVKCRKEDLFDELGREFTATAVSQYDAIVGTDRHGAGDNSVELWPFRHDACFLPPLPPRAACIDSTPRRLLRRKP